MSSVLLEKLMDAQLGWSISVPPFTETEASLRCPQEPATGLCPEAPEYNFIFLFPFLIPAGPRTCVTFLNMVIVYSEHPPNPQAKGQPIVGCLQLLVEGKPWAVFSFDCLSFFKLKDNPTGLSHSYLAQNNCQTTPQRK
jgi:hypothetical protein